MIERVIRRGLLCLIVLLGAAVAVAEEEALPTAEEQGDVGFYWIPPSGYFYGWVFLGMGYYSSLDGFGLGAEVKRPFQSPWLKAYSVDDLEISVRGRLYEDFHGLFDARLDAAIRDARWRVRLNFHHSTRLREFWGVGPDLEYASEELYRPADDRLYAELVRQFDPRFRIGVRGEWQNYMYLEMKPGGLLESGIYSGVRSTGLGLLGAGIVADLDSRDNRYEPRSGWFVQGYLMWFASTSDDGDGMSNARFDVRTYRAVSKKDVLAFQYFVFGVSDNAPVWRYAAIGGREHTRGYARNRYLDRKMMSAQVEWRRFIGWRLAGQLFAGSAMVAPGWSDFQIKYQRPTFGGGLSLAIPEVHSVAIRGDLAWGDETVHGRLAIGLAF